MKACYEAVRIYPKNSTEKKRVVIYQDVAVEIFMKNKYEIMDLGKKMSSNSL